MLADKYIFDEWDCPDTIQAALRYAGWDVVYEGMTARPEMYPTISSSNMRAVVTPGRSELRAAIAKERPNLSKS